MAAQTDTNVNLAMVLKVLTGGRSIECGRDLAYVDNSASTVGAERELTEDDTFAHDRHDHRRIGIHRAL